MNVQECFKHQVSENHSYSHDFHFLNTYKIYFSSQDNYIASQP